VELPEIWRFLCNISATAGASDYKFGAQLGFAKAHHKITRRRKCGRGPGLGFKFGTQLGFAKARHKTTLRGKVGVILSQGSSHIFVVPL